MHGSTSDARPVDVTGSHLLTQTTLRDMSLLIDQLRTSPAVSAAVGGRAQYNTHTSTNYSPMIGLRWEYSPMVGIKIASVLGGFFLLFAVYHTLKGVARCSKHQDAEEDDDDDTSEEDGKQSEEREVIESRLNWERVFAVKDDSVSTVRPEMRPFPHPLSQNIVRLQCAVEIPDWEEEDRSCEVSDSRTCA